MNALAARLERCKQYREEALKQPRKNALYIADLDLSIAMFEQAVKSNQPIVGKGWIDDDLEFDKEKENNIKDAMRKIGLI